MAKVLLLPPFHRAHGGCLHLTHMCRHWAKTHTSCFTLRSHTPPHPQSLTLLVSTLTAPTGMLVLALLCIPVTYSVIPSPICYHCFVDHDHITPECMRMPCRQQSYITWLSHSTWLSALDVWKLVAQFLRRLKQGHVSAWSSLVSPSQAERALWHSSLPSNDAVIKWGNVQEPCISPSQLQADTGMYWVQVKAHHAIHQATEDNFLFVPAPIINVCEP